MPNQDNHLLTLTDAGTPPETRIGSAMQARQIFQMMWRADEGRARKRQTVKGLIDGNPPYRQADLDDAGRSNQCNINWRVSESYLNSAVGAFYDLFNEAPTYATILLKKGTPEQITNWSRAVTTHFHWLCSNESDFDYNTQLSQDEMVLYGVGPMVFQDIFDWRPIALQAAQLKVPERTKSNTSRWELATVEIDYQSDELWKYILDTEAATTLGWNVERARNAIINACPDTAKGGLFRTWEWHQQQLKNGSLSYSMSSKTISVAHLFFREFTKKGESEGKISHVMIIRDSTNDKPDVFLFQKIARFDNWNQCIHPMYYDRGGGGFHHSVTGMGIKMFNAIELQNRMLCNAADKAMAPKLIFKPTTSGNAEEFSMIQHADYGVLAEGYDMIQTPMSSMMDDVMVFHRETSNLIASNLSQYRPRSSDEQGNPRTATEIQKNAQQEAALNKTQMNRYLIQRDDLYAEMYRRAVSVTSKTAPGGERALEFQRRCKADGVPLEAMKEPELVRASRVMGQGSEFLRQQSTEYLFQMLTPTLPEDGRANLIKDVIAARAGQHAVERYYPEANASKLADDQTALAMGQVADMKIGVPAVVTSTQNPMIFAGVFLQAADQAAGSLSQGAQPQEVASFLDLSGQAIAQHLQRMSGDPSRKQALDQMTKQWKQLAQVHDQLVQHIQQQQQQQSDQQQAAQEQAQSQQSDFALAQQKLQGDMQLHAAKTQAGIADKQVKTQAQIELARQKAAAGLGIQITKHVQATAQSATEHAQMMAQKKSEGKEEKSE